MKTPLPSPSPIDGDLREPGGGRAAALLLRCVDAQLAAVLFAVPLAMGGRLALGRLALLTLALGAALCWTLRQALVRRSSWVWCAAEPLLLAAISLVGLQLAPLPPAAVKLLSPNLYSILPLWSPDADASARLGVWPCLSLAPAATRSGLAILAAYALLFFVTVQRLAALEDVERLLRWVAVAGALMAAFGVLQYLTDNGKYFWLYECPLAATSGAAKGSFTNRNHFAHFLALSIGPLVWWLQSSRQTPLLRRSASNTLPFPSRSDNRLGRNTRSLVPGVAAAALALCTFAVLLSFSRGGAAALLGAAGVSLWVLYRGSLLGGDALLGLAAAAALAAACLAVHGYRQVSARLDDFQALEQLDAAAQRRTLWRADFAAAADFAVVGAGVGSHAQLYPRYLPEDDVSQDLVYTDAENGYLQIAMESGVPGLLLLLTAIILVLFWCRALVRADLPRRVMLCFAGTVPALAASGAHALVDFVWYVPGCMVVVVLLAAGLCRLAQIAEGGPQQALPGWRMPRAAWLSAAAALCFLACRTLPQMACAVPAERSWHRALSMSERLDGLDEASLAPALENLAGELARTIRWQPDHGAAHAKLAEVHLWRFQLAQGTGPSALDARQVREAALVSASQMPSAADVQAWLSRAFGDNSSHLRIALEHARRAVAINPLDGSAYLRLAAVAFLEGAGAAPKDACIQQALRVRPHDGNVLFEAGQEATFAGDFDSAAGLWRKSFQCGSRHQQRLIGLLAGRLPVTFFVENFPLDLPAIRRLEAQYRRLDRSEDVRTLLSLRAAAATREAAARNGPAAMPIWVEASGAHEALGDTASALACLRRAVDCDPCDFDARYALAMHLVQAQKLDEAEPHLHWCRQRKPRDSSLNSALEALVSRRLNPGPPR